MSSPKLILATRNTHKVSELRDIFTRVLPDFTADTIQSVAAYNIPEPVEDAVSFAGNALIKARQITRELGVPALADDSGLCVDVLGGAPGIFSARWAGSHGDSDANLDLLLAQLADVSPIHRGANFTCAAAFVMPDGREWVKIRQIFGTLRTCRSGQAGFGYDPIFQPGGMKETLAEISPEYKNSISHRAKAFTALAPIVMQTLMGVAENE